MGLDLFVMPLWKHLTGDFASPLARIVGTEPTRVGASKPDDPPGEARAKVVAFQRELSRLSGTSVAWSDNGLDDVSVQFGIGPFSSLQEFAAFQDQPVGDAWLPDDDALIAHRSLIKVRHGATTRFPNLIFHEVNTGLYIPCDLPAPVPWPEMPEVPPAPKRSLPAVVARLWRWLFPAPDPVAEAKARLKAGGLGAIMAQFELEMEERARRAAEASRAAVRELGLEDKPCLRLDRVGSSPALLRELDTLGPVLGMTKDLGQRAEGDPTWPEDDPLANAKYAWSVLHYAARVSVEKQLPIILDG